MRTNKSYLLLLGLVSVNLVGCSFFNKLIRRDNMNTSQDHYRVYAKNQNTGKVYYGGSTVSEGKARTTALRQCHRQAEALNVCQIIETH